MFLTSTFLQRLAPNFAAFDVASIRSGDLRGALNGALFSIPQNLAFGLLIGNALGNGWGSIGVLATLYGSVLVGLTAAVFGGCSVLVAGPRAATIVVFAGLLSQLTHATALAGTAAPLATAFALACFTAAAAGAIQMLFAALRLGKLVNFIPFPVVAGFVNSSAIVIIFSQLGPAMGLPPGSQSHFLIMRLPAIHAASLALALTTAVVILILPRLVRRIPAGFVAVTTGVILYHGLARFGLGAELGGTLAPLPAHAALRFVGSDAVSALSGPNNVGLLAIMIPAAGSMAVLAALDALLSVSAVDALTQRRSDSGRQLFAEGLGNVLAGLFSMSPGSSGMSRTQASLRGGTTTVMGPILLALITLLATVSLGPVIHLLPVAVMAGLLIGQSIETFDQWTLALIRRLLSQTRSPRALSELAIVVVVVATTVLYGLITAVGVGIALSLVLFVLQMAHSPIRRSYRATALIPRIHGDRRRLLFITQFGARIAIIELEGPLFFGSIAGLESRIDTLIDEGATHIVLDFKRVTDIDSTATRILERLDAKLLRLGGLLTLGYVDRERRRRVASFDGPDRRGHANRRRIWHKFNYLGTLATLGEGRFQADLDSAVALCETHLAANLPFSSALRPASEALTSSILQGLERAQIRQLRHYLVRRLYDAEEVIFNQGDAPDGVFFIASGKVEVMIDLPRTDRKLRVQTLTGGTVFGEMAVIDLQPRSAGIVAAAATRCHCLTTAAFDRLKLEQPEIAVALMTNVARLFAERLRATNMMIAEMEG